MYTKKVEILPNMIREIYYDSPIKSGYKSNREDYTKDTNESKTEKSLYRTRNNMKNLIDCNVCKYSKFVTFTFAEDVRDYNIALYHWKQFCKNYKRYYGEPLRYVAIMELQNGSARHGKTKETARNVWHIHSIIFNNRKLDFKILDTKLWGQGIVSTKKVDSTDNLGRYLMKYITKDAIEMPKNRKVILRSRNLKLPITIKFQEWEENYDFLPNVKKGKERYFKEFNYCIPAYIDKKSGQLIPEKPMTRTIIEYNRVKNDK